MKIKNKRIEKVRFDSIEEGEVFTVQGSEIYMKTESTYCNDNGDYENAVNLANGTFSYFDNDCYITVVKCELVID